MSFGVDERAAADEAPRVGDAAGEVGKRAVDPESTIATRTGARFGRRRRPRVERVVLGEVPLLRRERVCGREGSRRRRRDERGGEERQEDAAHQRATVCGDVVAGA